MPTYNKSERSNEHRHIDGCPQELFREGKNYGSGQSFKLFDGDYNEGAEKNKTAKSFNVLIYLHLISFMAVQC